MSSVSLRHHLRLLRLRLKYSCLVAAAVVVATAPDVAAAVVAAAAAAVAYSALFLFQHLCGRVQRLESSSL